MKIPKKHNKIKEHWKLFNHICHFDISVLIRYTISESLVDIQQLRHEWSSKMYENTQKTQYNQKVFHNFQSHLVCWYIKIFVLIRHTFCEVLVKLYTTKRKCRWFLWCIFWHMAVFPSRNKKNCFGNQKLPRPNILSRVVTSLGWVLGLGINL